MVKNQILFYSQILALFVFVSFEKRVFIDYSEDQQSAELAKLFLGEENGYYVDIGAFDPMVVSNTLDFYCKGWKGISLQANAQRFRKFLYVKPNEMKLHYAIANQSKIVKLYQNKYDSTSTTDESLQEELRKMQKIADQPLVYEEVAGITMAQMCQRYFLTSPKFLNLDVEGLSTIALMGNNWENPLCRPEVIFSQFNAFDQLVNKNKKLKSPTQILKERNYSLLREYTGPGGVTTNQIYISNDKFQYYKKKYEKNDRIFKDNYQTVNIMKIIEEIYQGLNIESMGTDIHRLNFSISPIYFFFCIEDQAVDLLNILRFSEIISNGKKRPIFLLNFNPIKSDIIINRGDYSKKVVKISNRDYLKIDYVLNQVNNVFYVFDHKVINLHDIQIGSTKGKILENNLSSTEKQIFQNISRALWTLVAIVFGILAAYLFSICPKNKNKNKNKSITIQSGEEITTEK